MKQRTFPFVYRCAAGHEASNTKPIVDTAYGYRAWAFFYDWARFEPQINQYRLREIRLGE